MVSVSIVIVWRIMNERYPLSSWIWHFLDQELCSHIATHLDLLIVHVNSCWRIGCVFLERCWDDRKVGPFSTFHVKNRVPEAELAAVRSQYLPYLYLSVYLRIWRLYKPRSIDHASRGATAVRSVAILSSVGWIGIVLFVAIGVQLYTEHD